MYKRSHGASSKSCECCSAAGNCACSFGPQQWSLKVVPDNSVDLYKHAALSASHYWWLVSGVSKRYIFCQSLALLASAVVFGHLRMPVLALLRTVRGQEITMPLQLDSSKLFFTAWTQRPLLFMKLSMLFSQGWRFMQLSWRSMHSSWRG